MRQIYWWASAALVAASLFPSPAEVAWKTYHDEAGVQISYPAGWSVERNGYTLMVRSQDRASVAVIQMFQMNPGETAQSHLQTAAAQGSDVLPQVRIEHVQQQPCKNGDEAVATLKFQAAGQRPGRGLALCLVQPQSGMGYMFVSAAPVSRLATDRPILARVLRSSGLDGGTTADAAPRFVQWTDPMEHAYTTDVPQGWKISGGTYRFGLMDPRIMMVLTSPDGQMSIRRGDTSVPTFEQPNSITMQTGLREGAEVSPGPGFSGILLHCLSAREFNHLYVTDRLSKVLDQVTIVSEEDCPDLADRLVANAYAQTTLPGVHYSGTVARAVLTATSRETGKRLAGLLTSWSRDSGPIWNGTPVLCLYPDDADAEKRAHLAADISDRLLLGYTVDPAWLDRQMRLAFQLARQQSAAIHQMMQQQAADFARRSQESFEQTQDYIHAVGQRADAQFDSDMQRHQVTTEHWVDYSLDREKLVNPTTGEVSTQPLAQYHYQQNGYVINSNDPLLSPGPDWTPLQSTW